MTHVPMIVGIDGRSGAGKTTLAACLAAQVPDPVMVHMDDLYAGWEGLAAGVELLAAKVLTPLRAGRAGSYRRFDWATMAYAERHRVGADRAVVIVEGCGATVGAAGALMDLRVWVQAEPGVRRQRGLGRTGQGDFAPHWQRWSEQEDVLFGADHTQDRADLLVVTDP